MDLMKASICLQAYGHLLVVQIFRTYVHSLIALQGYHVICILIKTNLQNKCILKYVHFRTNLCKYLCIDMHPSLDRVRHDAN